MIDKLCNRQFRNNHFSYKSSNVLKICPFCQLSYVLCYRMDWPYGDFFDCMKSTQIHQQQHMNSLEYVDIFQHSYAHMPLRGTKGQINPSYSQSIIQLLSRLLLLFFGRCFSSANSFLAAVGATCFLLFRTLCVFVHGNKLSNMILIPFVIYFCKLLFKREPFCLPF